MNKYLTMMKITNKVVAKVKSNKVLIQSQIPYIAYERGGLVGRSSPKVNSIPAFSLRMNPTPNNNFTSLKHFLDSRFSLLRCLLLVWYLLMNMNTLGRKTRGFGTARTLVKEHYHPFHNETDYVIASFVDSCC